MDGKNGNVPHMAIYIVPLEILAFAGIAVAGFHDVSVAVGITVVAAALAVIAALLYNVYIRSLRARTDEGLAAINHALDETRRRSPWTRDASGCPERFRPTLESVRALYDGLLKSDEDRQEFMDMLNAVTANMEVDSLFAALMPGLIRRLNSNWGAFYLANAATGKLELRSSIGFSKNIYTEFDITIGEGLVGAAATAKDITVLNSIPQDTIFVTRTFLGKIAPKSVMLVPVINNETLMGVLGLASVYDYTPEQVETVNLLKYYLGAAIGNCSVYERSKRITNELQFQNGLIQSLNEELEGKVRDRTLFLGNVLDSIRDRAIYAADAEGRVLEWNRGAEDIFGLTEDEIIGKDESALFPDGTRFNERAAEIAKNGFRRESGWRDKRGGGRRLTETTEFGIYNENGELAGITSVTKDITKPAAAREETGADRGGGAPDPPA
ncbi:MAG: PAS domain S-box protein [Clostridiales bacterium]|nr:PAS domain S-box protein [Clostridiales bacterium]